MGNIIIRDPQYCADYIRPHPNGLHGVYRLSYLGTGVPLTTDPSGPVEVTPEAVAEALQRLQERLPLGVIGRDYEILCTGRQLRVYDDDPASGRASGIRCPGWIALSKRVEEPLYDLLSHEFAHELDAHLTDAQRAQFWRIVGQEPGDRADWWHLRPQERLAEYLSAAIWGSSIDERIIEGNDPDPTPEVLARIREWALPIFAPYGRAQVTIGRPAPEPRIILTIGSTTALAEGREVELDVAPRIENGRTLVPIRFVAEALGCRVEWDQEHKRVLIY